jgi:regulator of replication initiation timing
MENYNEIFKELKNYFNNKTISFKKEITKKIDFISKDNKYFQDNLDKKIQEEIDNLKKFMEIEKVTIENLIEENTNLRLELELLKTSLTENKEIIKKEILDSLVQDISFIDKITEKTIEKLGV